MDRLTSTDLNLRLPYAFGNELDYLRNLGSNLEPGSVVVMLGFGPAVMAMALLEGAEDIPFQFYAVDLYNFTGASHLEAAGFADKVYIIQDYSWDASERFSYKSIDLLIVDACHDFECVSKDILAWWGKVKDKGIVFFHDYEKPDDREAEVTGVKPAIKKHKTEKWKELARPGISIVFRKMA